MFEEISSNINTNSILPPQIKLSIQDLMVETPAGFRILLVGPGGTWKTLGAVAIAKALGKTPVLVNSFCYEWTGETASDIQLMIEKQYRDIKDKANAVFIIEEAEFVFITKRNCCDIDTNSLFREWVLCAMCDKEVSIILTANDPTKLDRAIIDKFIVIPILQNESTAEDLAKVAMVLIHKRDKKGNKAGIERAFREDGRRFTGRNVLTIIKMAALIGKDNVIGYQIIREAIKRTAPRNIYDDRDEILALMAILYTDESRYLPWNAARILGEEPATTPEYIKPFLSDKENRIDEARLARLISDLESQLMQEDGYEHIY